MSLRPENRQPAPDVVRALAILMVLTIHVSANGLSNPVGTFNWWSGLFWGSLARPAVPLFFMCSGALMLSRDISLKRLYGHNFLRILAALFFWAFAYKAVNLLRGGTLFTGLWPAVRDTLLFRHEFHFYYLHILLLVYALVPVLRAFARGASRREIHYLLAVWMVTGILFPLLRYVKPFSALYTMTTNWYVMNMAYSSAGYALLGWYLARYGREIPRKWYAAALAAGLAVVFGGTAILSLEKGALVNICQEGMSPGPMLMAAGIMGLIYTKQSWRPTVRRFTCRLSRASFCIYLTHIEVLYVLGWLEINAVERSWYMVPAIVVVLTVVCWAAWEILHRIPIVKNWLV